MIEERQPSGGSSTSGAPTTSADEEFECWGQGKPSEAEFKKWNLLGELERGEITPADAEKEASRLGIRLWGDADPTQFDPMSLSTWTLPMALAWIMWGNANDVRRHWTEYRAKCTKLRIIKLGSFEDGEEHFGHRVENFSSLTSSFFELMINEQLEEETGNSPRLSAQQAWDALRRKLWAGDPEMTAIEIETNKPVVIPKLEFDRLDIAELDDEQGDALRLRNSGAILYKELLLSTGAVLRHWPENAGVLDQPPGAVTGPRPPQKLRRSFQKIANALSRRAAAAAK